MKVKTVKENNVTYYEVTLELQRGVWITKRLPVGKLKALRDEINMALKDQG